MDLLLQQLLSDPEKNNGLIDHDFELPRGLTVEQIDYLNKQLKGHVVYRIKSCEYSIPYGEDENYETPYFVYTENV